MESVKCPGTLFIVSAPSGGGKTSLVRELIKRLAGIQVSISHTTRMPRPGEVNGVHYHFVSEKEFKNEQKKGCFLESAEVFTNWYGTSNIWVQEQLRQGIDVILEIDWQGAQKVKAQHNCIGIFIMPPSKEALRARLTGRSTDAKATIEHRMNRASEEMSHFEEYDYVIINDVFEQAVEDLITVVRASRLGVEVQKARYTTLFAKMAGKET